MQPAKRSMGGKTPKSLGKTEVASVDPELQKVLEWAAKSGDPVVKAAVEKLASGTKAKPQKVPLREAAISRAHVAAR